MDKKERAHVWFKKKNKQKAEKLAFKTRKQRITKQYPNGNKSVSSYLDHLIENLPE